MRRTTGIAILAFILVLALGGTALAASPQDIYDDYAADGKLDGTYTTAEIQAYLNDATVHQYGSADVLTALDALLTKTLGDSTDRSTFPFTGAEMALIVLGGVVLVGGGLALRRTSR